MRPRTGSLVWRATGWSARYWAHGVRVCMPLGTKVREHAERKLKKLVANSLMAGPVITKRARVALRVTRIDLTCSECGSTTVREGRAAQVAIGAIRRGTQFYCRPQCARRSRYRVEKSASENRNGPATIMALANELLRESRKKANDKNDRREPEETAVAIAP